MGMSGRPGISKLQDTLQAQSKGQSSGTTVLAELRLEKTKGSRATKGEADL